MEIAYKRVAVPFGDILHDLQPDECILVSAPSLHITDEVSFLYVHLVRVEAPFEEIAVGVTS